MKLVLLFGPQAVGKMTVGQELTKITDLKLLHNHMTIELLQPFFGFTAEMWRLSSLFREEIFESFSRTDQYGIIFTFVWNFDKPEGKEWLDKICDIFESKGGEVYFVELEADLGERVKRNKTPLRLEQKPSKRNVEESEMRLKTSAETARLNSINGEINQKNYIRINNTNLGADAVAKLIKDRFGL